MTDRPVTSTKVCKQCKREYSVEQFWRLNRSLCKDCENAKRRKRWAADEAFRNQARERMREHRYGLSVAEQEGMLAQQGGICPICEQPISLLSSKTHIDHDHKTGVVRAILCASCNTLVGRIEANPALLQSLAEYLGIDLSLPVK